MKIKYIDKIPMTSKGITYTQDQVYTVSEEVGKYLIGTFSKKFVKIEEPKVVAEPEVKPTSKPKAKSE